MLRVLVVEDEPVVAYDLADHLAGAGFEVLGPASASEDALDLIEKEGCDLAVLDVSLGDETSEDVAVELRARGVPFVVTSATQKSDRPTVFDEAPAIDKPFRIAALLQELRRLHASPAIIAK